MYNQDVVLNEFKKNIFILIYFYLGVILSFFWILDFIIFFGFYCFNKVMP
jgi:hypothetical protein